jgi:hypothetical protein
MLCLLCSISSAQGASDRSVMRGFLQPLFSVKSGHLFFGLNDSDIFELHFSQPFSYRIRLKWMAAAIP